MYKKKIKKSSYIPKEYNLVFPKDRNSLKNSSGLFTLDGIEQLQVNANKMRKSRNRVNANRIVAEYYENYFSNLDPENRRANNVRNCFTHAWVDYYRLCAVKDIKTVNLCHDKFCVNCQDQLSQHRYSKYKPVLDEYSKDYDIYHVVFTVPNCSDVLLKHTLDKMYNKFAYLIRFFQGTKKIKNLDFSQYGFAGAIRSLEIGVKEIGFLAEMHPHFHCLFLLKKNFKNVGSNVNIYSYTKSQIKGDRRGSKKIIYFSDFEILLQKIWFLLFNDLKVNKKNIEELELGYSCYAKKVKPGIYHDIFKYSMKGMFDPKTTQFLFSESTFVYLLEATKRKKVIQGYGLLNKYSFLSEEEEQELDDYYNQRIIALKQIENPMDVYLGIHDLIKDIEAGTHIRFISKNSLRAKIDTFAGESNIEV